MIKTRKKPYRRPKNYVPQKFKVTDLAYLAGIVDGEGCFWIGIIKPSKTSHFVSTHFRGVLKIDNTDAALIDWIERVFVGTHSSRIRQTSSRRFERPIHTWTATGDRLLNLCELILPYLVIKKEHCKNMIKFRNTFTEPIGSKVLTPEVIAIRHECVKRSKKLNSRWHLHPLKINEPSLAPVAG